MSAMFSWAADHTGPWAGLCLAGAALLTIGAILGGIAVDAAMRRRGRGRP